MASSKKQKIPKSTKTAASKKQAEKRTTAASRRSSSAGKGKTPSRTPSRQERAALTPEQQKQRNQVRAVILFAVSILLFCLVLIPGESLWRWLHELTIGCTSGSESVSNADGICQPIKLIRTSPGTA